MSDYVSYPEYSDILRICGPDRELNVHDADPDTDLDTIRCVDRLLFSDKINPITDSSWFKYNTHYIPYSDNSNIIVDGLHLCRGKSRILITYKFDQVTNSSLLGIAISLPSSYDTIPFCVSLEYLKWISLLMSQRDGHTFLEYFEMFVKLIKNGGEEQVEKFFNPMIISFQYDRRNYQLFMFFTDTYIENNILQEHRDSSQSSQSLLGLEPNPFIIPNVERDDYITYPLRYSNYDPWTTDHGPRTTDHRPLTIINS